MRRKLFFTLVLMQSFAICKAQEPVKWSFFAKKIAEKTYEIRLVSTVDRPWHIYSQNTPIGGPIPTKIVFSKNHHDGARMRHGFVRWLLVPVSSYLSPPSWAVSSSATHRGEKPATHMKDIEMIKEENNVSN